ARMVRSAEALHPGIPEHPATTFGPLVSHKHREKVLAYYQQALDEGAAVRTGGGVPQMPESLRDGAWIQPTIWTGLPEAASVVREEIFGPCCHIQPFDDEEHAVAMANDTKYGLAATVWTQNLARAHRVSHQLDVGTCWVNSWYLRDLRAPFGGVGRSGIGREGGVHSLEFYTELRNICIKL
ncbi:MAG: aldehyde dehydrogenase family protein, partial [Myxococcota bacterium]